MVVNAFEGLKLVGYVVLNPDPTNLPLNDPNNPFQDLGNETHNPDVTAPVVWNYDLGTTIDPSAAALLNPRVQNPRVQNDSIVNPRVQNEGVLNPRVQNQSIVNNDVPNPRVQNTAAPNAALTDVTWTVTNEGNTTSVFTTNISSQQGVTFQRHQSAAHRPGPRLQGPSGSRRQGLPTLRDASGRAHREHLQPARPEHRYFRRSATPTQAASLGAQDVTFYLSAG